MTPDTQGTQGPKRGPDKNFGILGAIVMIVGLLLPAALFVGVLSNFNELHPWPTIVLTILIGLLACGFLVNWEWQVNKQWFVWAFVIYALYGFALAFWFV